MTAPATEAAGTAPAGTPQDPPPADPAKPETDWKAEARKWEARAKEKTTAAEKRLAEIEEAGKTEQQKVLDRAAAAEQRAVEAERRALRYEVASQTGVPADLLAGDTEESMREHAEKLKAFKGTLGTTPTAPRPDPSQGSRGPGTSLGREAGLEQARRRGFLPAQPK